MLVSSHVLEEVERFGSRVLVIAPGPAGRRGRLPRPSATSWTTAPTGCGCAPTGPASSPPRCSAAGVRRVSDSASDRPVAGRRTASCPAARPGRHRRGRTRCAGQIAVRRPATLDARLYEVEPLDDDLDSVFRYLVAGRAHGPGVGMTAAPVAVQGRRRRRSASCCCTATSPGPAARTRRPGRLRHARRASPLGIGGERDAEEAADLVEVAGLGLFAPLITLVLASAVLGEHAEDQTLVYLWMRPGGRSRLAFAAHGVAIVVAMPFVVVPDGRDGCVLVGDSGVVAGAAAVGRAGGRRLHGHLRGGRAGDQPGPAVGTRLRPRLGGRGGVGRSTLARTSLRVHLGSVLRGIAGLPPDEFGVNGAVAAFVCWPSARSAWRSPAAAARSQRRRVGTAAGRSAVRRRRGGWEGRRRRRGGSTSTACGPGWPTAGPSTPTSSTSGAPRSPELMLDRADPRPGEAGARARLRPRRRGPAAVDRGRTGRRGLCCPACSRPR